MEPALDKFGQFIVTNLRDRMLYSLECHLAGDFRTTFPHTEAWIAELNDKDRQAIVELVREVTTAGLHDLLFALQECSDSDSSIQVLVDGKDVAKLSRDGLHGEIFGEEGWIVRHSEYPAPDIIELATRPIAFADDLDFSDLDDPGEAAPEPPK